MLQYYFHYNTFTQSQLKIWPYCKKQQLTNIVLVNKESAIGKKYSNPGNPMLSKISAHLANLKVQLLILYTGFRAIIRRRSQGHDPLEFYFFPTLIAFWSKDWLSRKICRANESPAGRNVAKIRGPKINYIHIYLYIVVQNERERERDGGGEREPENSARDAGGGKRQRRLAGSKDCDQSHLLHCPGN